MKKLLLMTAMGVGLAACSFTPVDTSVCNRAAIAWDKWGDPVEMPANCLPTEPIVDVVAAPVSGDNDDTLPTPTDVGTTPPDGPEDGSDTHSDDDGDTDGEDSGTDGDNTGGDGDDDTGGGGDTDTVGLGNPGNDKNVGRAGEKVDKGMDENGGSGSRGNSTRRDN